MDEDIQISITTTGYIHDNVSLKSMNIPVIVAKIASDIPVENLKSICTQISKFIVVNDNDFTIYGDDISQMLCYYEFQNNKYENSFRERYNDTRTTILEFIIVNSRGLTQLVYRASFIDGLLSSFDFSNNRTMYLMDNI